MKRLAAIALVVACAPALAIMAVLQSQEQVMTVTGRVVWQCVYQIPGGQRFTQLMPPGKMCPSTIDVQ